MKRWSHSHHDILPDNPDTTAMQTQRLNVLPSNPNIVVHGPSYRVATDLSRAPLRDYLLYGFESERDFRGALLELLDQWGGRTGEAVSERSWMGCEGEAIDQRHRALRLRFHDTPGCCPDEAWLPLYMLERADVPDGCRYHNPTSDGLVNGEIDEVLGF